jgi:excinuclease ABC subunit B
MNFEEFQKIMNQVIFVSATPADYELEKCEGVVVDQIIRPTGLIDPEIEVRPIKGQIDDLLAEIKEQTEKGERTLALTLTKRMSEDLTDYLADMGIRVRYLHSEIASLDRVAILRELRLAEFDVLVGINLLREGLDLPEVSLVAILDADKEGFLRSEVSLMQIAGRAARNVGGKVIFYADRMTKSMEKTINETNRRRIIQLKYNEEHGITPKTIYKSVDDVMSSTQVADEKAEKWGSKTKKSRREKEWEELSALEREGLVEELEKEMIAASEKLNFEKAAELRDEIEALKAK